MSGDIGDTTGGGVLGVAGAVVGGVVNTVGDAIDNTVGRVKNSVKKFVSGEKVTGGSFRGLKVISRMIACCVPAIVVIVIGIIFIVSWRKAEKRGVNLTAGDRLLLHEFINTREREMGY